MINVVFFGRGGQGAVTASGILAKAVFKDNGFARRHFHTSALKEEGLQYKRSAK